MSKATSRHRCYTYGYTYKTIVGHGFVYDKK